VISKGLLLVRIGGQVVKHSPDQGKTNDDQSNRNECAGCSPDSRCSSYGTWQPINFRFTDRSLLLLNVLVSGAEVKPLGLEQRLLFFRRFGSDGVVLKHISTIFGRLSGARSIVRVLNFCHYKTRMRSLFG